MNPAAFQKRRRCRCGMTVVCLPALPPREVNQESQGDTPSYGGQALNPGKGGNPPLHSPLIAAPRAEALGMREMQAARRWRRLMTMLE